MQAPTKPSDPAECGTRDFAMDVMENAPFASVHKPGQGWHDAPWYIQPHEKKTYLDAYFAAADAHYGVEYMTKIRSDAEIAQRMAESPRGPIDGARERTPIEQQDAILRQIETFSENHAKYVYGGKLHLAFRPDPQTSGFKGSISGTPLVAPTLWELVHMMREDIRTTLAKKRTDVLQRHREVVALLDAADDAIRDDQRFEFPNGDVAVDLEDARQQRIERELADRRLEAAHAKLVPPKNPLTPEESAKAFLDAENARREKLDSVYEERNLVVLLMARLAGRLGWPVGLKQHDPADTTWEDEWRTILFVESPAGQLSWHLHESEKRHVEYVAPYEKEWDKHTTEEKYARVRALLDQRTNLGEINEGSTFFRTTKEFEVRALRAEADAKAARAELEKFIEQPQRGSVLELNAMMENDRRVIASLKDVNARLSHELNFLRRKISGLVDEVSVLPDLSMPKDTAALVNQDGTGVVIRNLG